MKFLMLVLCTALVGCGSMVRVVNKSEEQVALSYLPSHQLDADILAQRSCAKYGSRAVFSSQSSVDERVVATWNCER